MSDHTQSERPSVAYPDNVAMRCLLEEMRDNSGAISPSAGRGAAAWALGRIKTLEDYFQLAAAEARRYAENYPQSSDGRNTFVMLADRIEGIAGAPATLLSSG